jgi:hypothetical protein
MDNNHSVVAVFDNSANVNRAAEGLKAIGIKNDQVSLLVSEGGRGSHFKISEDQTKVPEGVGYGAVLGGLVAGLTALAIPGSIFVAGPVAGAIAAGGVGAAAGGLTGGLVGLGIPEHEAKLVEGDVDRGDIVIAVHQLSSDREEQVERILEESNAKRVVH